jgi:hypothetical protein
MCLWKTVEKMRTRIRELRALGLPDWDCVHDGKTSTRGMGIVPKTNNALNPIGIVKG